MKLSQHKEEYQEYTSLTSASVRQLAFAGIAVIWIFKYQIQGNEVPVVPPGLITPLFFFALSLLSDLFQYISGYIIHYRIYKKNHERGVGEKEEVHFDGPYPVFIIHIFMASKIVALITGYIFLSVFIGSVWG